jgi:hypothetical protein
VAPPIAHVTVARKFGDQPSAAAARSFSALAEMASPIRVKRVKAHSAKREHDRDGEQEQPVLLHDDAPELAVEAEPVVQRVVVRGEELVDLVELGVPELLPRETLQHDQDTERRDEAHDRRGGAHEPQDAVLDGDAEDGGQQHRDRDRGLDGPPALFDERQEAEERGEHRDAAVREVHDARPAVDEDDALREQRVRGAGPQAEDRELNGLRHWFLSARFVAQAPNPWRQKSQISFALMRISGSLM